MRPVITTIIIAAIIIFSIVITNEEGYTKGKSLFEQKDYYGAIANFLIEEKDDKNNFNLYLDLGNSYYNIEKYNEALDAFNKATKIKPNNKDAKIWVASTYIMLANYTKAEATITALLSLDPNSSDAYNLQGQVSYSKYMDEEALVCFEKAIDIDATFDEPYINKAKTLYAEKKYEECIAFTKSSVKLFPNNINLYLYAANSLSHEKKHVEAIKQINLGLKISLEDPDLLSCLGWEYLYTKDFTNASKYCTKALSFSPDLKDALDLQDSINKEAQPETTKIVNFVKENYLYLNEVSDFEGKTKAFEALKTVSAEDVSKYIDSIKVKSDYFTYTLTAKNFDSKVESEKIPQVSFKNLDTNTSYIKINSFNPTTDLEFKRFIQKIPATKDKNLVIDLRNDTGGLIEASNNILDLLLPSCTSSFTIDRTGKMYSYYSDDKQIIFKKIIVLVNNYTASSSELLTLGLKDYLDNVVVIGQETYGKGVGQNTYDNEEKKFSIFLVSFYWNVKETNIYGVGIFPDVTIGTTDSDYFNEVNKLIK